MALGITSTKRVWSYMTLNVLPITALRKLQHIKLKHFITIHWLCNQIHYHKPERTISWQLCTLSTYKIVDKIIHCNLECFVISTWALWYVISTWSALCHFHLSALCHFNLSALCHFNLSALCHFKRECFMSFQTGVFYVISNRSALCHFNQECFMSFQSEPECFLSFQPECFMSF